MKRARSKSSFQAVFLSLFYLLSGQCSALECNQTASPVSYIAFPAVYGSSPVITPSTPGCVLHRNSEFQCDYTVALGDGVMVPSPPDLNSEDYLGHFITWERNSHQLYIDFDLRGLANGVFVHAIELSFLNSPANRISLPDLELNTVNSYGSTFLTDSLIPIWSTVVDNQDLTLTDNQIRTITLQPIAGRSSSRLRITFQFTTFHNFDWFFLSEVRFCTELQPNPVFDVMFQTPSTIIQPSADDLRGGSSELVCIVSSQGSYTWQWEKDNSLIGNGDPNYDITIGDGSRTTKLMISNLDFSDAGRYECTATTMDLSLRTHTGSLIQEIQFPEVISAPDVSGYLQTGEVTLTCELHGYQSSFSSLVWLNMNGSEITTSDKYTISSSDGVNTIVLENGTTLPSVVVSLTIHNLTPADNGSYICRGTGGEGVAQLTLLGGTAPPTTPPPITIPPSTTPPTPSGGPTGNGTGNGGPSLEPASNTGVVAAAVIVSLIIVAILVVIATIALVFIYVRISDNNRLKNTKLCTTVRQMTREDTETVNQPPVYETIPEDQVQTFTKNEAYVTQESAVMTRNEAYTTLSPVTRVVLFNDENTEYEVIDSQNVVL